MWGNLPFSRRKPPSQAALSSPGWFGARASLSPSTLACLLRARGNGTVIVVTSLRRCKCIAMPCCNFHVMLGKKSSFNGCCHLWLQPFAFQAACYGGEFSVMKLIHRSKTSCQKEREPWDVWNHQDHWSPGYKKWRPSFGNGIFEQQGNPRLHPTSTRISDRNEE